MKMRTEKRILGSLGWLCMLLLLISGCKSTRKVETVEGGKAKSPKAFFAEMEDQALPFRTFSARLNADLKLPGKEISSRIELKIVKDSALLLSVQPFLGIEVFRAQLTTDSIKILDRLNKRYVAENYENLRGQTPIEFNFYNLQALFTNRLFLPGEQEVTPRLYNRFKLKQEGASAEIKAQDKMGLQYLFNADGEGKLLATRVSDPSDQYVLDWGYADFRLAAEHPFPMLMDVNLFAKGKNEGGMKLHFSRIQTDTPLNMDFSIPSKYKRITFAQILKSLSNANK